MSGAYRLEIARPEDRPLVVRFFAALQDLETGIHASRPPGQEIADAHIVYLERECAAHDGAIKIAWTEKGEAVGLLIYLVEEEDGHHLTPDFQKAGCITDIWIEPAHRGSGLLDRMMQDAEVHFRGLGLRQMVLSHVHGNEAARRAYAKRGFAPVEIQLSRPID